MLFFGHHYMRVFVRWAEEQGIDPFTPTAPQLASFLHYLRSVKDLDPQTVKGYRTSLASVLLPLGMSDAINSPVLSHC
jgi:site-specific recombinase XerC